MIVKASAYYSLSAVCVMYQKAFSLEEKRGHPILRSTNTFNAATSGPSNHGVPTLLATTQVTPHRPIFFGQPQKQTGIPLDRTCRSDENPIAAVLAGPEGRNGEPTLHVRQWSLGTDASDEQGSRDASGCTLPTDEFLAGIARNISVPSCAESEVAGSPPPSSYSRPVLTTPLLQKRSDGRERKRPASSLDSLGRLLWHDGR